LKKNFFFFEMHKFFDLRSFHLSSKKSRLSGKAKRKKKREIDIRKEIVNVQNGKAQSSILVQN
jgi:hypothetical protein